MRRIDVVLAAGGTGGHLFPAAALAEALAARGLAPLLVTDRRGLAYAGNLRVRTIPAGSLAGSPMAKARGLAGLAAGLAVATALLMRCRPGCVVGFGGYPAVPTTLAARLLRLPLVLHEQNALLGRANRLVAGHARRIATSFPETAGVSPRDRGKLVFTGNPVRRAIADLGTLPYAAPEPGGPLSLLVVGGSQGARALSDVLPTAVSSLPPSDRARLRLVQQCRPEDLERVRTAYAEAGVAAELATFFDDMPARLATAQLIVTRAGASTIGELLSVGRPAILVPYPHAADDHQTANAVAMERLGAAWTMPEPAFTPEALAARLAELLATPATLANVASRAAAAAPPDAAEALADLVELCLDPARRATPRPADLGSIAA